MPDEIERELQFEARDLAAVERWIKAQPAYAPLTFGQKSAATHLDTYLDTDDWAIYRSGFALRVRRKQSGGGEVTLKALASTATDVQQRREIKQPIDEYNAGEGRDDTVSGRVKLIANGRALSSLFEVETYRANFTIRQNASALAVLSLDTSRVQVAGQDVTTLSRVEIEETRTGSMALIGALVDALRQGCELVPAETTKFEAGLVAAGLSPRSALDFGYAELSPDATAGEYAYALLRRYLADLLAHEPGTRLGEDVEELHDMRVATRRLRAMMSLFHDALPPRVATLRDELKWVAQNLGEVRDLDVYLDWLHGERERSDWVDGTALGLLIANVEKDRAEARGRLVEAMATERYASVIENLKRTLREGDDGVGEAARPIALFGRRMLRKHYKRVRRDGDGLGPGSEAGQYHAVRVACKRLRYALESLEPVFPRRARQLINATKDVQDLLGEHQDCAVAIERLKGLVLASGSELPPGAIFHTGELAEHRRNRMREIRLAWPEAFDDLKQAHRAFAKRMHAPSSPQIEKDEGVAGEPDSALVRPPVQRPFSLLQRFFSRGSRD